MRQSLFNEEERDACSRDSRPILCTVRPSIVGRIGEGRCVRSTLPRSVSSPAYRCS